MEKNKMQKIHKLHLKLASLFFFCISYLIVVIGLHQPGNLDDFTHVYGLLSSLSFIFSIVTLYLSFEEKVHKNILLTIVVLIYVFSLFGTKTEIEWLMRYCLPNCENMILFQFYKGIVMAHVWPPFIVWFSLALSGLI